MVGVGGRKTVDKLYHGTAFAQKTNGFLEYMSGSAKDFSDFLSRSKN